MPVTFPAHVDAVDGWFAAVSTTPFDIADVPVQEGDYIILSGGTENGGANLATPSSTPTLTWTSVGAIDNGSGDVAANMWRSSAIAAGTTSVDISVTVTGTGTLDGGVGATVARGVTGFGTPVSNSNEAVQSLTPGQYGGVIAMIGDWNAVEPPYSIATGSGTGAIQTQWGNGASWGGTIPTWSNVSSGAANYGLASYSGHTCVNIYLPLTGDSGGPTVPAAISDLAGTAGDTEVDLSWTAPDNGGSSITDYVGEYTDDVTIQFPTIPTSGAGRILSAIQSNTTATRTFPDRSGLSDNAGDLLIAIVHAYQTSTGTNAAFSGWTGGFTEFHDSATSTTSAIGMAYKWSTGGETGTFAVTQAGTITGNAVMILLCIPGAHASTIPEAGSRANGTAAAANPGAFNPVGWDVENTLWIAVGGVGETALTGSFLGMDATTRHTAPWAPTPPTNFTDGYATGCSSDIIGGNELAVGFRQEAAASQDVGVWAPDLASARNDAVVIGIRPAAVVWSSFSDGTSTTPAMTITGLTNDIAYNFRVATVNAIGQGSWSNTAGPYTPVALVVERMKRWNGSSWVPVVMKHGASWATVTTSVT